MPSIQNLKKELRGIRSTQKLTKAMRSVSMVKFSRLRSAYGKYSDYGQACRKVFAAYQADFLAAVPAADPAAPPLLVVIAGNKGLCGKFNTELLKFAQEELDKREDCRLIACGKKAVRYFQQRDIPLEAEWALNDEPTFAESTELLRHVMDLRRAGEVSGVHVICSRYDNMMVQTPVIRELFPALSGKGESGGRALCVPDRGTVIRKSAPTVFGAMLYELVLSSALGAQAATLMTMRAAYDAATEYCAQLEREISRRRQSAVTADVIETSSSERAML